jgi:multidrug efflux pump
LKFRVSGPDPAKTREFAQGFAQVLGQNADTRNINYDWNEPAKVIKVDVDQDRARALGISSTQLANSINAILSATRVTQLRDSTYLIDIVARAIPEERTKLESVCSDYPIIRLSAR